jgi:hypothetical protein
MDEFVHRQNILLFRKRLAEAPDEAARQILLKLLAEEEAKLAQPCPRSKS